MSDVQSLKITASIKLDHNQTQAGLTPRWLQLNLIQTRSATLLPTNSKEKKNARLFKTYPSHYILSKIGQAIQGLLQRHYTVSNE